MVNLTCHEGKNGPLWQWTFLERAGLTTVNTDGTGSHSRMWVVDIHDTMVLIYATFDPVNTSQADADEVLQMGASVRFE